MNSDENLDERWPQDGDRLFVEVASSTDAHIVRDPGERFYRLPTGYKRAADLLIDQAAGDVVDRRNIVYAALFCYRQSIELFLKRLIEEFGGGQAHSPKYTHDLSLLWDRFTYIVNQRGGEEWLGLEAARSLVAEMHEADHKSDGFRFAMDRNEMPFEFGDKGIDLANLREVMMGLANFFECAYSEFSHQDDMASDAYLAEHTQASDRAQPWGCRRAAR